MATARQPIRVAGAPCRRSAISRLLHQEASMTRLSYTARTLLYSAAAAITWLLATISYLLANAR